MRRTARWLIALAAMVGAFVLGLWVAQQVHWSWLARSEADRWVVAAGFATVVATGVLTATAGWADHEPAPASTAASPGESTVQAGSGDHVEFHGDQYGPTLGKGTQNNYLGRGDR